MIQADVARLFLGLAIFALFAGWYPVTVFLGLAALAALLLPDAVHRDARRRNRRGAYRRR